MEGRGNPHSLSLDNVGSRPREVEEKKWVHGGDGYTDPSYPTEGQKAFSSLDVGMYSFANESSY